MNYLAHYAVALRANADAIISPAYFVGIALPDLLGVSGDGRLRAANLLNAPEPHTPLARGAALHLATDKRFHGLASFADAQAEASALLRATPFSFPLRRVFFLAHVLVEIAFDGYLLRLNPGFADAFYAPFAQTDLVAVVEETQRLLQTQYPLLGLARTLEGFTRSRYLRHYDTGDGQAEAVSRVCQRAGLPGFDAEGDRAQLAALLDAFTPRCQTWADDFLTPPA